MGSSRKLFLLLGILFVSLFLLSSQVAPSKDDQTGERMDKKNGDVVHSPSVIGRPLRRMPIPCTHARYGSCIPRPPIVGHRRCNYHNRCGRPPAGKSGEFTNAQFKDDFHN